MYINGPSDDFQQNTEKYDKRFVKIRNYKRRAIL